jgi:FkbM family methyltransferase
VSFNPLNTIRYYIKKYGNAKHPFRYFLSQSMVRTPFCRLLSVKMSSFRLRFYPSCLSSLCYYNPAFAENDEHFLELYLKPGNTFVDIGANIGVLTLKGSTLVGDTGRVFSIEPHPVTFKYLTGNIELNRFRNIQTFNCAVGAQREVAHFSDKLLDAQNHIVQDGGIQVTTETLDDLLADRIAAIDLLKIDVEGYEKYVVSGAEKILRKAKCVYFESYQPNFDIFNYKTGDLIKMFLDRGFEVLRIKDGKLHRVTESHVSDVCENLIAVRDMEDFRSRTGLQLVSYS